MLENLNYIYMAMYALDIYDSILFCLKLTSVLLAFWAIIWIACAMIDNDCYYHNETVISLWKHTKVFQIISLILVIGSWFVLSLYPSKNTVKAYIGVKATQAVGTYLNDSTEIPEHCKKTINNLWSKVDDYIETIDVSNVIDNITDSTTIKINKLKNTAGKDAVDDVINLVKQHTIDSLNAIKH